jgi:pSer/pThr/pTyr-binding forkhead associated (FHA) protein
MTNGISPLGRGGPYLTVSVNYREVSRRPITGPITIGRASDCDLALEDPMASRKHCHIEPAVEGDGWAVSDLESRNGTLVNGKTIDERRALTSGDIITIGKTHITFHASGYQPPRPSDPYEAMRMPPERLKYAKREPSNRPLPSPKVANNETMMPVDDQSAQKPLPFTRPPARPIVKPLED